jgi:hypothetical protein
MVGFNLGHFVAYCRRASGKWQQYDDMQVKIGNCNADKLIEPHLAIYIRKQVCHHEKDESSVNVSDNEHEPDLIEF